MTGVEGAFMGQEAAGSHRPRIVFHLPGASSETVGEARNDPDPWVTAEILQLRYYMYILLSISRVAHAVSISYNAQSLRGSS